MQPKALFYSRIKMMIILEKSIVVSVVVSVLFWRFLSKEYAAVATILSLVLVLVQFAASQFRWQLAPACVGVFILVAYTIRSFVKPHALLNIWILAAALLCAMIGLAMSVLFPLKFLPQPQGAYGVGTITREWQDTSRKELFSGADEWRTLVVQIWYPIDSAVQGTKEPYVRDNTVLDTLLKSEGSPIFITSYLGLAETNSITGATPASKPEKFPVVVFAAGNMGYRQQNTRQMEALASQGYVVVAYDAPGVSGTTTYADGHRIDYPGSATMYPLVQKSTVQTRSIPRLKGALYSQGIIPYFAADTAFIVDKINRINSDPGDPLHGKLDTERVGALGMSLGGTIVSQWCATDSRVKACMMLDAPATLEAQSAGLRMPALWLTRPITSMKADSFSDSEAHRFVDTEQATFEKSSTAWYVQIAGAKHVDFTDFSLQSAVYRWTHTVSQQNATVQQAMDYYSVHFFDATLRGSDSALSDLEKAPIGTEGISVTKH